MRYLSSYQCHNVSTSKIMTEHNLITSSISYGEQEIDLPAGYQERQCNEFLKLGLQGVSIFVASGDTGVAGTPGSDGNANGCIGPNKNVFNPTNPNTCPYVSLPAADDNLH